MGVVYMTNTQKVKDSILEILKKELEYQKEGYSQWVMGVSIINHNKSIFSIGLQDYVYSKNFNQN